MSAPLDVIVSRGAAELANDTAQRLLSTVARLQAPGRPGHVVLTGGGIGTQVLAAVARSAHRDTVDWGALHLWWGDERFLPHGHPERNDTGADETLLRHVAIPAAHVHRVASPTDGDLLAARDGYAEQLAHAFGPGSPPGFDVLLLGVGPDGHVASLFPDRPGAQSDSPVVAVADSPKPPSSRISLGMGTICAAREVWLLAAGEAKAEAVLAAATGTPDVPAARARGRDISLLLVDREAASLLPRHATRVEN